MGASFTSIDLDRLTHAMRAASRQSPAQTLDDWRSDVLRACCDLLDGHMGHFDVFGWGLEDPHFVTGYPEGVFDEWRARWGPEGDDAFGATARLNTTVFTRKHRFRLAGEHWTARYKRSSIYSEFYKKNGLFHGGGLYCRCGEIAAYLVVESDALASDAVDEYARRLLGVVEPVFQSAIRSLTRSAGAHWSAAALLDALNEPIALVRADGHWMHRSAAFETALAAVPPDSRPPFLAEVQVRAQELLKMTFPTQAHRVECVERPITPTWTSDLYTVALTTLDAPGDPEPTCLVRLVPRSGASLELAAAAGLTERESVVAMLLVDGLCNKEIAQRLSISPHTTRRHTESILRKLGISNRTSVARALNAWAFGPRDDGQSVGSPCRGE